MSLNYQTLAAKKSKKPPFKTTDIRSNEKPKVLLIEDDRSLRRMVRAEIGGHCDLLMAGNMSLGATMFKTERPDLAFIDISLPDGSGYSLLDWMLKSNPDTFAVMFSGYWGTENIFKSVEMGAKGFVSKPHDPNKLLFFINQCQNF